ncbi:putative phosphatase regulatory subunit-domain-containing protein [Polychytrium aggregatum]|uniref:putative phosphatase regulatory subunit-domain-containing protein n=1 Tax=Polychytrium aggregatum TaxID=110093 RepID=UPI0022FEF8AA|nr:putative phosphatase regulatory subunit-domain-containing protein [Polychytrium aggregatum]KAI9205612.1 putative phosphatase regulatory subunit-domain-containing protein [Polychytrium aggregatum]
MVYITSDGSSLKLERVMSKSGTSPHAKWLGEDAVSTHSPPNMEKNSRPLVLSPPQFSLKGSPSVSPRLSGLSPLHSPMFKIPSAPKTSPKKSILKKHQPFEAKHSGVFQDPASAHLASGRDTGYNPILSLPNHEAFMAQRTKKLQLSFDDNRIEQICFFDRLGCPFTVHDALQVEVEDCDDVEAPSATFAHSKIDTNDSDEGLWEITSTNLPKLSSFGGVHIMLETITTEASSLKGDIVVRNLAFEKNVVVHYSFNDWVSKYERTAVFSRVACHRNGEYPGVDIFSFELYLPGLQPVALDSPSLKNYRLSFALRYEVNGDVFWDNNHGRNYVIELTRRNPLPQLVPCKLIPALSSPILAHASSPVRSPFGGVQSISPSPLAPYASSPNVGNSPSSIYRVPILFDSRTDASARRVKLVAGAAPAHSSPLLARSPSRENPGLLAPSCSSLLSSSPQLSPRMSSPIYHCTSYVHEMPLSSSPTIHSPASPGSSPSYIASSLSVGLGHSRQSTPPARSPSPSQARRQSYSRIAIPPAPGSGLSPCSSRSELAGPTPGSPSSPTAIPYIVLARNGGRPASRRP